MLINPPIPPLIKGVRGIWNYLKEKGGSTHVLGEREERRKEEVFI